MEILRKVSCKDRLPNEEGVYHVISVPRYGSPHQSKDRGYFNGKIFKPEYGYRIEYWYEPITIELKSEEILPNRCRIKDAYAELDPITDFCGIINLYNTALEAAELEIAELKASKSAIRSNKRHLENTVLKEFSDRIEQQTKLISELITENQGLKLAIENNHGGNCIIAPKEEVEKVAKERYKKALKYAEEMYKDTFEMDCKHGGNDVLLYLDVEKALKIAAYGK